MILGTDYDVLYENNIEVGEANITINGINYFDNAKNINFTIVKAKNRITSFSIVNDNPVATSLFGQENIIYKYYKDKEGLIELSNRPDVNDKYYVKAYVPETKNYESASSDLLEINPFVPTDVPTEKSISERMVIIMSTTIPISFLVIISLVTTILVRKFRK